MALAAAGRRAFVGSSRCAAFVMIDLERGKSVTVQPTLDPIVNRFKAALHKIYGDRLDRVVLFGSRARGEANDDSDYDVAIFLKSLADYPTERKKLADLRVEFIDDAGVFFDTKPYPITAYHDRTPLMYEIRRDGLDL